MHFNSPISDLFHSSSKQGRNYSINWGCMFMYSSSVRLISFEIRLILKEISGAEHECMNIHPLN